MEQFVRKRIIGIAFGEQEINVCAHFQDQIAEVLRLPAVFTVSPVGEVLTGNRAVRYAEICHSSRPATAPPGTAPIHLSVPGSACMEPGSGLFLERDAYHCAGDFK